MNNIDKYTNSNTNGATEVELGSFDDGEDDEHNGVSFVGMLKIFAMQDNVLLLNGTFNGV